ncbi:MAG: hypothetical protein LBL55_03045 [Propionibacteriaceae bacterium]|jgi:hypothetical protein|nr:hypothetical protein [Propionibacteriaceae bacterium]
MACFLVPAGEAIIATIIEHRLGKDQSTEPDSTDRLSWRTKLSWLTGLLWGGSILLALEHLWHGEVSLKPPFLTALGDAEATTVMLREMGTVGLGMAALVTAAWLVMVLVADRTPALRRVLAGSKI